MVSFWYYQKGQLKEFIMAVLPAPSGYSCVRLLTNFTQDTAGSKTIPSGSHIYVPTARGTAMAAAGVCAVVTVEPAYSVFTGFGDGSGQWADA